MDFEAIDVVRQVEQEADQLVEPAKQTAQSIKSQAVTQAKTEAEELMEEARIKARQLEDVAVKVGEEQVRPILEEAKKKSDEFLNMSESKLSAVADTIVERILG